jgi:hypothetical protein
VTKVHVLGPIHVEYEGKGGPHADIRVATLISVRQDVSHGEGPGRGEVGGATYYGQLVKSRNFQLPWTP